MSKPQQANKRIHLQLTRDDLKLLDTAAKTLTVSRTSVVRMLIRKHCKKLTNETVV